MVQVGFSADAGCLSDVLGGMLPPAAMADARDAGFVWTLLPRHGRRPVRFLGREMLRAENRAAARALQLPRWSDIQIYELHAAGFVTAVRHLRCEDDHSAWHDAWPAHDAADVIASLRDHNVTLTWPDDTAGLDPAPPARAWQDLVGAIFGAGTAA